MCHHGIEFGCALCAGTEPVYEAPVPLELSPRGYLPQRLQARRITDRERIIARPSTDKPQPVTYAPLYEPKPVFVQREAQRTKPYTTARWSQTKRQKRLRKSAPKPQVQPKPISENLDEVIANLVNAVRPSAGGTL
jgi:hypothetical protein